jgi:hypothetical protein
MRRENKQAYLYDNIVCKNYSAQEFKDFLEQLKVGGSDIDSWEFEGLVEVVAMF